MAREFRIECGKNFCLQKALKALKRAEYYYIPTKRLREDEVWLSLLFNDVDADVRIFPERYGFFIEISNFRKELCESLKKWVSELREFCSCTIFDNDTEEIVDMDCWI